MYYVRGWIAFVEPKITGDVRLEVINNVDMKRGRWGCRSSLSLLPIPGSVTVQECELLEVATNLLRSNKACELLHACRPCELAR